MQRLVAVVQLGDRAFQLVKVVIAASRPNIPHSRCVTFDALLNPVITVAIQGHLTASQRQIVALESFAALVTNSCP